MSSGAGEQGHTDIPGGAGNQPVEGSRAADRPAEPGGDIGHLDKPSVSSTNPPSPPAALAGAPTLAVGAVQPPTTTAPPQAHVSPLSYSSELPPVSQDAFHDNSTGASTSIASESDHTSTSSQWLSHSPTHIHQPQAQVPETRQVQSDRNRSQETITTPLRREQTTPLNDKSIQASPQFPFSHQPPRASSPAADTITSGQPSNQIRILSESSLARFPEPQVYSHPQPTAQESHGTFDSEVGLLDPEARRSFYRRHHPLPPLPGRVTSFSEQRSASPPTSSQHHHIRRPTSPGSTGPGLVSIGTRGSHAVGGAAGPSSNGHPDPSTSGAHGQEATIPNTDTRHTSVVPILGTATSHPTIERSTERSRTLKSATVDWLTPSVEDKQSPERTLGERLDPTLEVARTERDKYAAKAKLTGWALNIAIGLQVVLGAMTTGLSVVTTGRQTSIMTAILGGFATIVASFLARARGSHEPELSITRAKDLEQFIRECEAFKMDYGLFRGSQNPEQSAKVETFRDRFEDLLGNASGERRMTPA
ncbi:hypothetical protein D9756_010274 [Leucocoprinus leucothites]|uniref:SMODS and SLOG-associating 2TM effector domain-containing protein n=1 Tax=Leucocoprinus leucothites TaxID=201217 RepID=A0A8H5CTY6_9AGAR|nr:hypothetical protein D9756_010274 [Leucoagaricus leucothites]